LSDNVKGIVEKVSTFKEPKYTKVSIQVKGEYYGGFVNPKDTDDRSKVKEGDQVEIEFQQNGRYKNILNVKLVTPSVAKTAPKKDTVTTTKTEATTAQEYIPQNVKEARMSMGNGLKVAIEFVDLALRHEALVLPKVANKKADALAEYVKHYAKVFASEVINVDPNSFDAPVQQKEEQATEERNELSE
jgi:hypothetical protein